MTLWRLTYDYANAAREDGRAPLPVFVRLGSYTDTGPFDAYLARYLGPLASYLDTCRASGRLILLLGGLNEMPPARLYRTSGSHSGDVGPAAGRHAAPPLFRALFVGVLHNSGEDHKKPESYR